MCLFSLEIEHKGRRHAFKGWIVCATCVTAFRFVIVGECRDSFLPVAFRHKC